MYFLIFFVVGIGCMLFKVCLVSSKREQHVMDSCRRAEPRRTTGVPNLISLSCRFGWGDCWKCHWSKLVAASCFRCIRKSQKAMQPNKATCHKADGPHKVANDNIMTHWQPPKIVAANLAAIKPAHNIRKKKHHMTSSKKPHQGRHRLIAPFHNWWTKLCVLPASCSTIPPVNCWKVHRVPSNLLVDLLVSHRPCPETLAWLPERHCQVREVGGNVEVHGEVCTRHALFFWQKSQATNLRVYICFFFPNFYEQKTAGPSIHA